MLQVGWEKPGEKILLFKGRLMLQVGWDKTSENDVCCNILQGASQL